MTASAPLAYGYIDTLPPSRDLAPRVAARGVEGELAERARRGDAEAFAALHDRYHPAVRNYLFRLTDDWHLAQDLAQDVFLKAWLKIGDTAPGLTFPSWVYKIALNAFRDHARHEKLVRWEPWDAYLLTFHPTQVDDASPERDAEGAETAAGIRAVIDTLGGEPSACDNPDFAGAHARWRDVLVLREYHDLTYTEIADRLGTTRAAVKTMLFRARRRFRQLWLERERAEAVS